MLLWVNIKILKHPELLSLYIFILVNCHWRALQTIFKRNSDKNHKQKEKKIFFAEKNKISQWWEKNKEEVLKLISHSCLCLCFNGSFNVHENIFHIFIFLSKLFCCNFQTPLNEFIYK